ncbi:glutathione S-transferase T3-like [Pyrus ussuriensis x Pyrus communis]|uniref:Glutathione S-transferase T3-like n=1 Tax=Pyrus ussuriensis x Pyrus communis TaxID=2448454 RepID=A0A5N5HLW9_9ROSA|nr:glutathione S-transferase T3-like [Pyrus ussuriensis x Pyrus communis]
MEPGTSWSTMEDVLLCECWVRVAHDPLTGSELKLNQMWKQIRAEFSERSNSTRTEQSISSRWKTLNKKLRSWRNALEKAQDDFQSGKNLTHQALQALLLYSADNKNKSFKHHNCWAVVKGCPRFKIVSTCPTVVKNKVPRHNSPNGDLPLESPVEKESPTEKRSIPVGKKVAKKRGKKGGSFNECAKFLKELVRQGETNIERERLRDEALAREREYARNQDEVLLRERMDKRDREIMSQNPNNMSSDSKLFWEQEKADVMKRRCAREDGPSNTELFQESLSAREDGPSNTELFQESLSGSADVYRT